MDRTLAISRASMATVWHCFAINNDTGLWLEDYTVRPRGSEIDIA